MSATDGTEAFDLPPTCAPQFGGFQSPTKAPPEVNTARAGSSTTTRFVLTESGGEPDIAAAFATQQVDCTTLAPSGPIAAESGDLDNSRTRFRFEWRSERAWAGTCRQLIVRVQDVSDPVAYYRFT
jgi:hypothetical protein